MTCVDMCLVSCLLAQYMKETMETASRESFSRHCNTMQHGCNSMLHRCNSKLHRCCNTIEHECKSMQHHCSFRLRASVNEMQSVDSE